MSGVDPKINSSRQETWHPKETISVKGGRLRSAMYRDRGVSALKFLDEITLPPGSRCLEISRDCGKTTLGLAGRNFKVVLLVQIPAIAAGTQRRLGETGSGKSITLSTGKLSALGFRNGTFDLVLALDLFPWELSPGRPLGEIMRVLRPGGYLITSIQNRWRLSRLFDPRLTPVVEPLYRAVRSGLSRIRRWEPGMGATIPKSHSVREITEILKDGGLAAIAGKSAGFGPFTFFGKRVMPDRWGKAVHSFFQLLANSRFPCVWRSGYYYIVLARKEEWQQ